MTLTVLLLEEASTIESTFIEELMNLCRELLTPPSLEKGEAS